ncbi:Gag-Pol [Cucumis melo var. makuwa]|uniref:Gag-Pol n=1 Tax=Cucumis melo var. makuwa TaxID=1194695 RepID=A0A5D3CVI7_CUCMM|nr:Gag-Pol [Cucumis melo var. makuwa]TYK14406.1 Gag-Pol [Cucumis melo var. makuwa]
MCVRSSRYSKRKWNFNLEDMKRQFTTACTPQQNKVAEQMNKTLLERTRAMLRVVVYVMYNSQETTKLDPKSRRCLLLGYADGVKGYRLWYPIIHKVIISRDAIFMEDNKQVADNNTINESSKTATVHVEKEFVDDSSEAKPIPEIQ